MTELINGQITDLLRNNPLRYSPEIEALSYAVLQEKRRIMAEEAITRTMAMIDDLPDKILDVLAVELRTPAYNQGFPLRTKRELIKGTLAFYAHLGTPWAVSWATSTIFGNGHISEWFEYGGDPHHFRVTVTNDGTFNSLDGLADFMALINAVKRLSSWLDDIAVTTDMGDTPLRVGGTMASLSTIPLPEAEESSEFKLALYAGGVMAPEITIHVPEGQDPHEFVAESRVGVTGAIMACMAIPEQQ